MQPAVEELWGECERWVEWCERDGTIVVLYFFSLSSSMMVGQGRAVSRPTDES